MSVVLFSLIHTLDVSVVDNVVPTNEQKSAAMIVPATGMYNACLAAIIGADDNGRMPQFDPLRIAEGLEVLNLDIVQQGHERSQS